MTPTEGRIVNFSSVLWTKRTDGGWGWGAGGGGILNLRVVEEKRLAEMLRW